MFTTATIKGEVKSLLQRGAKGNNGVFLNGIQSYAKTIEIKYMKKDLTSRHSCFRKLQRLTDVVQTLFDSPPSFFLLKHTEAFSVNRLKTRNTTNFSKVQF